MIPLMSLDPQYAGYFTALGLGLLIGVVRERQRDHHGHTPAGMRTHTIAALGGAMLARQLAQGPVALQSGTLLPQGREVAPFALTDHEGAAFGNAQLAGRPSLLFFGFTWFALPALTASSVETLPLAARLMILLAGVAISCGLAGTSERVFERPLRAAGRRVLGRWPPRPA